MVKGHRNVRLGEISVQPTGRKSAAKKNPGEGGSSILSGPHSTLLGDITLAETLLSQVQTHRNILRTSCLLRHRDMLPIRVRARRTMEIMWLSAGSLRQYKTSTKSVNSCKKKAQLSMTHHHKLFSRMREHGEKPGFYSSGVAFSGPSGTRNALDTKPPAALYSKGSQVEEKHQN